MVLGFMGVDQEFIELSNGRHYVCSLTLQAVQIFKTKGQIQ
jgi:hypothetical protein